MKTNPTIETFWQAYLNILSATDPHPTTYEAWGFGNSPQMADDLGHLVKSGTKTATCSLLWEYEADGDPLPQVDDHSIILDGNGEPLCIIKTVEVEIKPYIQVDAQFAYEEGEGDRSLAYWRKAHWNFFGQVCGWLDRELSEEMPLVCERFQMVYPPHWDT